MSSNDSIDDTTPLSSANEAFFKEFDRSRDPGTGRTLCEPCCGTGRRIVCPYSAPGEMRSCPQCNGTATVARSEDDEHKLRPPFGRDFGRYAPPYYVPQANGGVLKTLDPLAALLVGTFCLHMLRIAGQQDGQEVDAVCDALDNPFYAASREERDYAGTFSAYLNSVELAARTKENA